LAETALQRGVSTSAVARMLARKEEKVQFVNNVPPFFTPLISSLMRIAPAHTIKALNVLDDTLNGAVEVGVDEPSTARYDG